ncbi:MAG: SDR family NAD(P)-dependent oxidoreductase [Halioglobus sp.]
MSRLEGKFAFITGAASGIGLACAKRFSAEGATIFGADVNKPADEDWHTVTTTAPRSMFTLLDVTDEDAVKTSAELALKALGRIDILVNSAGVAGVGSATDLDTQEFQRVLDINLKGSFLTSKHLIPSMVEQRGGSIVNLSSVFGLMGSDNNLSYCVSKGGVLQLTTSLSVDYAWANVRSNALCPGLIETPLTEIVKQIEPLHKEFVSWHLSGRPGQPEEVASAALFLASDEASFITGQALAVDGGLSTGRRLFPAPSL